MIAQTGKRAFLLEVRLGADGLPRRVSVAEWEPRGEGERYPTTWRATVEVREYGVDFDVLRPPARKVMTEQQFDRPTGS